MTDLAISCITNCSDNKPQPVITSWEKFVVSLCKPEIRGNLTFAEYSSLDPSNPDEKSIRDNQKDGMAIIAGTYSKPDTRTQSDLVSLALVTLDLDDGKLTFDQVCDRLEGFEAVVFTSYSHSTIKPKFRAYILLQQPIATDIKPTLERLIDFFDDRIGSIDPACRKPGQLFYTPACPPGGEEFYQYRHLEGVPLDPAAFPAPPKQEKVKQERTTGTRPGDDFDARATWPEVLEQAGWHHSHLNHWTRPGKRYGVSGSVLDAGFYCHTSAPEAMPFECGKSYSLFGAYAVIYHNGDHPAAASALAKLGYGEQIQQAPVGNILCSWPESIDLRKLAKTEPNPPKFIIPGWLPCGYATMLSGHGGAGKSSISLVLIVCMALGIDFYGNQVEQRKVLFLSCEDRVQVLHWRLSHICRFFGISMDALFNNLFILDLVGHDNILYQPLRKSSALTPYYQELSNRIKEYDTQVLVVDGISDTFDGNENSRAEPKAFVNSLLALVPPEDGALILLGHVAKASANNAQTNEGYSGSTAWHNAVRARWYLYPETKVGYDKRPEPTGKLILELQKSNLGKADKSMCFEWDDSAHMFAHVEIAEESHFDKNYRETKERNELLLAIVNCTVDIPAACSGPRTAFHVLAAQSNFPFSANAGSAERKRFWVHIEALRAKGMVVSGCITREDRHKVITLIATDKAKSECGHAGYG